ncbi:probable B3 domain-containing protein At3g19184 at N-terminal half [Coccomyxa sp. Obi]|nr:probable B3 domain-containing protein At3g19184 at N-terminal half [Coccomyxa sp. Obi]
MSNENEGLCQYELDRLARIAENKKRMQEMGIFKIADDLAKKCAPKKKPQQPRAKKLYVDAGPVRRSDRQQNKAPVNYADDIRLERIERQPRTNTRQQRRMPVSSKVPNFPIQSAAAIRLATEAAKAKVAELGNRSFYKEMQPSNVSSGYWLQLPVEMGTTWQFPPGTNNIELECHDDCRNADGWVYEKYPGEDRKRWYTVWLVRGGNSCGLSGGWRGFAIDQQLTWNDTVVFEVPADVPEGQLPTYILIHTYRAENYETDETLPLVVPAKEVYESLLAKLPTADDEDDDQDAEEEQEGTPVDSADGGQAAGKDKAAVLKAKKKRIAEVAGSLRGAAREHKRQKKAAEKGTSAEEQADEDMTGADNDAELAPATPDADEANAGAMAAVEADAAGAADAGAPSAAAEEPKKKRRGQTIASGRQPFQRNATAKGKENNKKEPRRKAAQNENETVKDGSKSGKARAAKEEAPVAEKPPAPQSADREEGEEQEEEEEERFYVRKVLKARKVSTTAPEFLIRWWYYTSEHDTWEPLSSLDADPLEYDWADAAAKEKARSHAAKWRAAAD